MSELMMRRRLFHNDLIEDVWLHDASFYRDRIFTISGWLISPAIYINPGDQYTFVAGSYNHETGYMVIEYDENGILTDYWSWFNTEVITDYIGKRTVEAASGTAYIRITIPKEGYFYANVKQNGITLFDGSLYPPQY